MTAPTATNAEVAAYARGRQDEADACAQKHLVKLADVLGAIDQRVGNPEQLRQGVLTALRCDAT